MIGKDKATQVEFSNIYRRLHKLEEDATFWFTHNPCDYSGRSLVTAEIPAKDVLIALIKDMGKRAVYRNGRVEFEERQDGI